MESHLNDKIKNQLKVLGYYQIIGGIIGLALAIITFVQAPQLGGLLLSIMAVFISLFSFSIFCGERILRGNIYKALKFSSINQIFQVFSFGLVGYSYKFTAGIFLSLGIDLTNEFNLITNFSLSSFQFNVNSNTDVLYFSFNLVALFLVYHIDKLQKQIKTNQ